MKKWISQAQRVQAAEEQKFSERRRDFEGSARTDIRQPVRRRDRSKRNFSVVAKRLNRVDSSCPAGRDVSGSERAGGNQRYACREGRGIEPAHEDQVRSKHS